MKQKLLNTLYLYLFYLFTILYLEILFKIRVLSFAFDDDLMRIVLFSMAYALMILFLLKFFGEKAVRITTYVLIPVITFLYLNQEIYSSFVEGFYSLTVIGDFTAGLSFFSDYFTAFRFGHISYALPIAAMAAMAYYKILKFDVEYCGLRQPLYFMISSVLIFFLAVQTIDETTEIRSETAEETPVTLDNLGTLISYSDMDLYTYMYNSQDALKKFGLLTYTQRDFFRLFRSNPLSQEAYEVLIDDFLENRDTHPVNTYTSIFRDKNFILIMAESLDTFAIHEELTPTLWQLKQDYAYFENFYSPLYYRSTADSEFLVQTSLYPDKNVTLTMEAYMDNTYPNTLPKLFEAEGYSTYSFHNYFDYFYPRGEFHRNALGYDQFWGSEELGITAGFDPDRVIINHVWESDYEMMQKAIPKFINDDKFFVNMLTVSGHFNYNENHEMARPEYVQAVQDYFDSLAEPVEYTDDILYYLAIHMEVDRAIAYLIDQLEEAGKMDDTVIMIFGDHYAYGIDNDDIWDYENEYKIDGDELDIHNVPMMIISSSGFMRGVKTEYMSTIDVMPTIANLFGLRLNYRTVFGNDALANRDNIVRFADGSFVSEHFRYDSLSENVTIYDNSVTELYLFTMNRTFMNNYMYNLLILEYDYFDEDD